MLRGIDISKWQSVGTGDQAADFIICKATEGVGYVDPLCDKHYQRAKAQGKLPGVYHFARPDKNTAEAEAEFFVKNIKGYIGEALLALDYEVAPYSDDWAYAFCAKVHELTGVWPVVYMSASKVNGFNWSKTAKECGLWIAGYPKKYDVKNPPEPGVEDMPYKTGAWKTWAIWQYTSSAGTLDRDIAYMDRAAWKKYANPASSATPEPQPTPAPVKKTNEQIADEVIAGKWDKGEARKQKLAAAGYNYQEVQNIVNKKLGVKPSTSISYAVRRGDTLSAIAKQYGTTVDKIVKDNGIKDPNLIFPGQRLIIKK